MAEIGLSMFFTLQLLDGPQDVGAPQFIGPKMIWQRGNRSFCFGLGRVHVDGKDKICSVYWYQSESGNLIAVERSDWSTIGYLRGGTSCSAYSDFGSEIKPMTVQKAPYAWHHKNQDGVQCKLWTVPQDKLQGQQHFNDYATSTRHSSFYFLEQLPNAFTCACSCDHGLHPTRCICDGLHVRRTCQRSTSRNSNG
jgi:hypothetical protein